MGLGQVLDDECYHSFARQGLQECFAEPAGVVVAAAVAQVGWADTKGAGRPGELAGRAGVAVAAAWAGRQRRTGLQWRWWRREGLFGAAAACSPGPRTAGSGAAAAAVWRRAEAGSVRLRRRRRRRRRKRQHSRQGRGAWGRTCGAGVAGA